MRIIHIAHNTFLEAVRQKFFIFLLIVSAGFIISSYYLRNLGFGISEIKFMFDFGYGALFLFGTILSIVTAAILYFNEIENRTVVTLLAKPISRYEFILGKFIGVAILLLIFTALLSTLQCAMLYWRETVIMTHNPQFFPDGRIINYQGLMLASVIQWVQFLLVAAITLFLASFSTTNMFTIILSLMIVAICQVQYVAQGRWIEHQPAIVKSLAWVGGKVFPNFQVFNVSETLFMRSNTMLSMSSYAGIITYGLFYTLVLTILAGFIFRKREF